MKKNEKIIILESNNPKFQVMPSVNARNTKFE